MLTKNTIKNKITATKTSASRECECEKKLVTGL